MTRIVTILVGMTFLFSFQWPVPPADIATNFGERRSNGFFGGLRVTTEETAVKPVEEGEVIFHDTGTETRSSRRSLYPVVVLQHDRGFRSLYGRLASFDPKRSWFDEKSVLGRLPEGEALFLAVFDSDLGGLVNPLVVLPSHKDVTAPSIESVWLERGDLTIKAKNGLTLSAGEYTVRASLYDRQRPERSPFRIAPYIISINYLGNPISHVQFDVLREKEGELVLSRGQSARILYEREGTFFLGKVALSEGQGVLRLEVADSQANRSTALFRLEIFRQ